MSDIGNRGASADRDTFRVLGGVKGDLNKTWSYEAFASYGFTKEGQTSTGQVNVNNFWNALQVIPDSVTGLPVCADATARLQGCVPANVFGANTLSAAAAAYINAPATLNTKVTQQVYGLTVTGEPFILPAGPVGIAAGLEYRKETSKTEHDALTISGLNAGNALPDTSGSFNVNEYFVEGRLPLLKNMPMFKSLDGTLAVRQGNYSTVGNTTSWNSGLDWALNSTVRLRATASVSTRAPNINELYQGASQTFPTGLSDPCEGIKSTSTGALADRCKAAPGVLANMAANGGTFTLGQADNQGVSGYDGGNPNLKAEKGNSKTLGIVITPKSVPLLKNFNFTADYYDISIEDALNLPGRQFLLNQCYQAGDAASCAFITRRNTAFGGYSAGSLDLINQGVVNSGGQTAKGIDLTAGYADKVGPGYLSGRVTYTHLLKAEQRATSTAPSDSTLGEIGNPTNKWMLNLGYDYGKFAIKSTVTYIGESYLDNLFMIDNSFPYEAGRVGSVTYLDLQTTYSFNKKSQLYFGIDNVLDTKAPPIISGLPGNSTGAETDAGTYDPIGRRFYIGLRYSL
jgi:outer membrane receptor protein involved in Fe transport